MPSLVEFWRRNQKCQNFTDRQTDEQKVIKKLTWVYSSVELKIAAVQVTLLPLEHCNLFLWIVIQNDNDLHEHCTIYL